ncbi:hypothetical protein Godav_013642 [Gossypium davidsonii]|uniref:Uncharacterized protein n=2 Tax=Gossypium TaxID=3633 RepID=A0A7J8RII1_GOSDV|nr:hypothetical protein [Gossypium davidsonii]MBA0648339.1 hypothetical protein [Gossypium klotzschianum]
MVCFLDPTYRCFTFNKVDMVLISRNILPFSNMTLEIYLGYIGSGTSIFGDP